MPELSSPTPIAATNTATELFIAAPNCNLQQLERDCTYHVLHAYAGNIETAAVVLGVEPEKLSHKLQRYQHSASKLTSSRKQTGAWPTARIERLATLLKEGLRAETICALPEFANTSPKAVRRIATRSGLTEIKLPKLTRTRAAKTTTEPKLSKWQTIDPATGKSPNDVLAEFRASGMSAAEIAEHDFFKSFTTKAMIYQKISTLKLPKPERQAVVKAKPAPKATPALKIAAAPKTPAAARHRSRWADKDARLLELCRAGKTPAQIHAMDEFKDSCTLSALTQRIRAKQWPTNSKRMSDRLDAADARRREAEAKPTPLQAPPATPRPTIAPAQTKTHSPYREPKVASFTPLHRPDPVQPVAARPIAVMRVSAAAAQAVKAHAAAPHLSLAGLEGAVSATVKIHPGLIAPIGSRAEDLQAELALQGFKEVKDSDGAFWWRKDGLLADIMQLNTGTRASLSAQLVGTCSGDRMHASASNRTLRHFKVECAALHGPCEVTTAVLAVSYKPMPIAEALHCLDDLRARRPLLKHWAVAPSYGAMTGIGFGGRLQSLEKTPTALRPLCLPDAGGTFVPG